MKDEAAPDKRSEAEALSHEAGRLLDAGSFEGAAASYGHALDLDAGRSDDWINRGLALWHLDRNEEALNCYDRALEIDPKSALAWMNRGNALKGLKRPSQEVLDCYDRALEIDPRLARAWYNKGDELGVLSRFIEAKACFENARDLGMNEAIGMVNTCNEILMNEWYA